MAVKLMQFFGLTTLLLLLRWNTEVEANGQAHSFQHFRGPVHGDDKEVMWMDDHGKPHRDYAAPANYEFAYGVEDHHTGDYHGQKEHRDGKAVAGEYTVKEPDGNVRTVKYHADEDGFHATVHNSHDRGGGGGAPAAAPVAHAPYPHVAGNSYNDDDEEYDES